MERNSYARPPPYVHVYRWMLINKKPCVLGKENNTALIQRSLNDCILLNKIQIYKKMRIKTFFKTLIPLKTFLLILMCTLFSSVLLAQA